MQRIALISLLAFLISATDGRAQNPQADSPDALRSAYDYAQNLESQGKHFDAAVNYFNVYTADGVLRNTALVRLTGSLLKLRLHNAAVYFFLKVLQTGDRNAIQTVLTHLPEMIDRVGGDVLRPYVLRHTNDADYDAQTRNHFYYFLGKDALLKGDPKRALQYLARVASGSGILAQSMYLRGSAFAMVGDLDSSVQSFIQCRRIADRADGVRGALRREFEDLHARCIAGQARSLYQAGKYSEAEEAYDDIPKAAFVWTDVLFEQAWSAFAKGDYNRALGKLVTYRSPALGFVFNPEVEVLRAQSFFALCHYDDVNRTVNDFNRRFGGVGNEVKKFLLANDGNLAGFFKTAKQAHATKLHTSSGFYRVLNRFVRGPYFSSLVAAERETAREIYRVRSVAKGPRAKFGRFLEDVLNWRLKSIRLVGGLFVKNATADIYRDLLSNLDKMSFIKLEMLKYAKGRLERTQTMSADDDGVMQRGMADIDRKDYQYFWTFNGEFWADELGDYVFALESLCSRN